MLYYMLLILIIKLVIFYNDYPFEQEFYLFVLHFNRLLFTHLQLKFKTKQIYNALAHLF